VIDGKPIISLPGYPVSNAVAFRVFLRPLISYLLETEENIDYSVKAKLSRRVANIGGLRTFVRVRLFIDQDKWIAEPIMASGAGVISSLTGANALLIIPEDKEGIDEGDEVEVILLRPLKARKNG
jgi:molybdopterin molybdotransferase